MEDYGYYHKKKGKRRAGAPAFVRVADTVMLVLTVACTLLLLAAYLARYIDPRRAWVFAFPGLVFPAIYVAELMLCLWWIVRWKKYAVVVAAVLLAGIGAAGRFYRPDLRRHYDEPVPSRSELVVMSYNVMGCNGRFASGGKSTAQLIVDLIDANNVDIVCFQELGGTLAGTGAKSLLPDLKYSKVFPYESEGAKGDYFTGLGIFSRYPIVASGLLPAPDSDRNFSMWADIRIQRDTVRVFNNHLNSTYIENDDIDFLSSLKFVSGERTRARLSEITGKLRESYMRRAPQAMDVAAQIEASPYPVIVCGDFNDTPASFAYGRIARGLHDAFVERGSGASGTYDRLFNMFRIDYIMVSDGLEVVNYYTFDEVYSDHMPVAAGVELAAE
ncbi:MAG TPA: endonuclease/exonuclease/phosphatase family protein [Candidatus Tidjanibacter gallistercoris]|nr:endonuclease/exonuclease/phosphatase family protein [Candidatus Tidjanibacter gallistercoris]